MLSNGSQKYFREITLMVKPTSVEKTLQEASFSKISKLYQSKLEYTGLFPSFLSLNKCVKIKIT